MSRLGLIINNDRNDRVRHIRSSGAQNPLPLCAEMAWGRSPWRTSKSADVMERPVCKKCLRIFRAIEAEVRQDPLIGEPKGPVEPMKGQVWRGRDPKRRKQTVVITKVQVNTIHVKPVTDIKGQEIAPVLRSNRSIKIPIEAWSTNWIPV